MAGKDIEENGQKVKRLKEFFQDKKEAQTEKKAKKVKKEMRKKENGTKN